MNLGKYFKSKLVLFIIQIILLSTFIYVFHYSFNINFDSGITFERERIIQFLASYIMFEGLTDFLFILLIWILTSLISIFILKEPQKTWLMNLTTFFFPNFFFYVFLFRYSPQYFNNNFTQLLLKTFIIALILVSFSIGLSFILKSLIDSRIETREEKLEIIVSNIKTKCPNCGTEFNSTPKYCYKCNSELIKDSGD
ncbi:MAG: hypothetical protein ACFFC9_08435 [Promethearchaeota archaeon]